MNTGFLGPAVATVLTVYGIETLMILLMAISLLFVATVLTVYGIETQCRFDYLDSRWCRLQQYLPFTVLKLNGNKMNPMRLH